MTQAAGRDADPLAREHRLRRVRGDARRPAALPGRAHLPARRREPQRARVLQPARGPDPDASSRPRSTAESVRTLVLVEVSDPERLGEFADARRARRTSRSSSSTTTASPTLEGATAFVADRRQPRHEHAEAAARAGHRRSRRCTRRRSRSASTRTPGSLTYSSTTASRHRGARRLRARGRQPGAARALPARPASARPARRCCGSLDAVAHASPRSPACGW